MLTKLKFERFKNFKEAELALGPFTVLIGSNASGKSNIRDAFRFLHGISRGYKLAEIMGEKYGEGGFLQWQGIRGGTREVTYLQANTFKLAASLSVPEDLSFSLTPFQATYSIEIKPEAANGQPKVENESLYIDGSMIFDAHPPENSPKQEDLQYLLIEVAGNGKRDAPNIESFPTNQPVLTQFSDLTTLAQRKNIAINSARVAIITLNVFKPMRFLELSPYAMRQPSGPGQTVLGDRGENLSSVLQSICEEPQQKKALTEWVRELTPMDVVDFEFIPDQTGRILVNLIEANGRRTSAYSASDGTLRFLGILAALLGPEPARIYFIEELENGLHPARLHLLLQLIEQQTAAGQTQVIATTHSPQLLRYLSRETHEHASLVYRLPDTSEGRIARILDIPEVARIIEKQDLARLHETGWFEDAMYFLDGAEVAALEARISV